MSIVRAHLIPELRVECRILFGHHVLPSRSPHSTIGPMSTDRPPSLDQSSAHDCAATADHGRPVMATQHQSPPEAVGNHCLTVLGTVIVAEIVCAVLVPGIPSWVVGTVFAVTVLFAATYILMVPAWRYRVHRWEISDTAVYTRTGWFTQERRIAPISRVQTVDTERGPIDRMLGLATVTVTTASSAGGREDLRTRPGGRRPHGGSTDGDRGYQRGRRDVNEKQLGDPTAIEIPVEAETAAAEAAEEEQPWLRLDRRMLLVHPRQRSRQTAPGPTRLRSSRQPIRKPLVGGTRRRHSARHLRFVAVFHHHVPNRTRPRSTAHRGGLPEKAALRPA